MISKHTVHEMVVQGKLRENFRSADFNFGIDISKIREIVLADPKRWPMTRIPLSLQLEAWLRAMRDIDDDRVSALTLEQLREPVFVTTFPDAREGVCPIDGHHRIVRLVHERVAYATAYLIPWQELPHADPLLPDFPWGDAKIDQRILEERAG